MEIQKSEERILKESLDHFDRFLPEFSESLPEGYETRLLIHEDTLFLEVYKLNFFSEWLMDFFPMFVPSLVGYVEQQEGHYVTIFKEYNRDQFDETLAKELAQKWEEVSGRKVIYEE